MIYFSLCFKIKWEIFLPNRKETCDPEVYNRIDEDGWLHEEATNQNKE